ncbi:hypothetical protein [Arthrobacter sp. D3-16]
MAADPVETTVCAPTGPDVGTTEGETTYAEEQIVAPAAPIITEEREDIEPLVAETRTPGQPVITTTVNGTGQTCTNNPSNAQERANRC